MEIAFIYILTWLSVSTSLRVLWMNFTPEWQKNVCDITCEVVTALEDKQALPYTDDSSAGHLFESHHAPSQQENM